MPNIRAASYKKALNKAFAPEFINRIDDIVMFDQLSRESIYKIIDLELNGLYTNASKNWDTT